MEVFKLTTSAVAVCSWVRHWNFASFSLPCVNAYIILTRVKYVILMTLRIIVTKPFDFQGDVVTGEEVAHSKYFKLSEVWEKRKYFSVQYSQFLEEHCFVWRLPGFTCRSFWKEQMSMEHWWNDAGGRTKVVGEGPVPFCLQILQWLIQGQTWICMTRGWQLSAWAMTQLFWRLKFMYIICKRPISASQKTVPVRGKALPIKIMQDVWIHCGLNAEFLMWKQMVNMTSIL